METTTKTKTSYEILSDLCKVKNLHSSYYPSKTETTPRMDFIVKTLKDMGLNYKVDIFEKKIKYESHKINHDRLNRISKDNPVYKFLSYEIEKKGKSVNIDLDLIEYMNKSLINLDRPTIDMIQSIDMIQLRKCLISNKNVQIGYYGNIIVELLTKEETTESTMFVAHHDIKNVKSDNCADNSASVCNLLQLANELKEKDLKKNIYIVFTDGEEFGGKGAKYLSEKIIKGEFGNVDYIINLEITGRGQNFWAEKQINKNLQTVTTPLLDKLIKFEQDRGGVLLEYSVPFNDSVIFRQYGIDSVCIGIITDDDVKEVSLKKYCETWSLCHSIEDKFSFVNENDMKSFVKMLHEFI